jgi:hypothetical protein
MEKEGLKMLFDVPFKESDIVRQKFTQNYYLVVDTKYSERTGEVVLYKVMNLNSSEVMNLHWRYFEEYELTK